MTAFEPGATDFGKHPFCAYAVEVARIDVNGDGVISAAAGDVDTGSDGFADNRGCSFRRQFDRSVVMREINDGPPAPRFAPGHDVHPVIAPIGNNGGIQANANAAVRCMAALEDAAGS